MILDQSRILIKTQNLNKSFKYKNDVKEVLKDIDISVLQGEFVIIKGIKGIEKNTFFNLMGCIERPTAGKLYFDYEDIGLASGQILNSIRKHKLGYLFSNFNLISSMTVEQNLIIPLRGLSISRNEKVIRLERVLKKFGIEDIVRERIYNISSFKKQIVALARSIINNPLMIIADEPTANLSIEEERRFIEHIWGLNQEGMTIMLICETSEINFLNDSRHIYFENGRVSKDSKGIIISPMKGASV